MPPPEADGTELAVQSTVNQQLNISLELYLSKYDDEEGFKSVV